MIPSPQSWIEACEDFVKEQQMDNKVEKLARRIEERPMAWSDPENRLDNALCNFCNGCRDDFEPVSKWDEESWRNFRSLCDAYNVWHSWIVDTKGELPLDQN